jgi:predicted RNase H-like HicB family nuclease
MVATDQATEGVIVLTGTVDKEDDQFVSYCRELGTASCGDTVDEALANLGEAIEVHLEALEETGELLRFLRERNIRIDIAPKPGELHLTVPLGKIMTTFQHRVTLGSKAN